MGELRGHLDDLLGTGTTALVVDLGGVTFIDSTRWALDGVFTIHSTLAQALVERHRVLHPKCR